MPSGPGSCGTTAATSTTWNSVSGGPCSPAASWSTGFRPGRGSRRSPSSSTWPSGAGVRPGRARSSSAGGRHPAHRGRHVGDADGPRPARSPEPGTRASAMAWSPPAPASSRSARSRCAATACRRSPWPWPPPGRWTSSWPTPVTWSPSGWARSPPVPPGCAPGHQSRPPDLPQLPLQPTESAESPIGERAPGELPSPSRPSYALALLCKSMPEFGHRIDYAESRHTSLDQGPAPRGSRVHPCRRS